MKNPTSWMSLILVPALLCLPGVSNSEDGVGYGWHIYETKTYVIAITETCRPGDLQCDATYVGTNKRTGASILLKGKTAVRMCNRNPPDTACGVDGWDFQNGSVDYLFVTNGGLSLNVSNKGRPVQSEDAKLVAGSMRSVPANATSIDCPS